MGNLVVWRWTWVRVGLLALCLGCVSPGSEALDLPEPELSGVETDVRLALRRMRSATEQRLAAPRMEHRERARLLTELGLMYQAHLILEPALACFRAAAREDPQDHRWPYHLGLALEQDGRLEPAEAAYARSLVLDPGFGLAKLRLGRVRLAMGRAPEAEAPLRGASDEPALRAAALFELGKSAYARGDYPAAVDNLQRALRQDPEANRIHYPLALAYRQMGRLEEARRHLALRGDRDPAFPDPFWDRLKDFSTGQRMLFHAGMDAAQREDFNAAAELFRQGLEADGGNVHARVSLARFLYMTGSPEAAETQLREALHLSPGMPLAGFLLAVLLDARDESLAARSGFESVLERDPGHAGANFYLANNYMRGGEYLQAALHYEISLRRAEGNPGAWFWRSLASIRAGVDHVRLKALLETALKSLGDDAGIRFLLASLLAASPDPAVRDGGRALDLAQGLTAQRPSVPHLEVLAMAQAETGAFDDAVESQERVLEILRSGFRWGLIARAEARLEEYRAGKPSRQPWSADLLDMAWPAAGTRRAILSYPPERPY